MKETQKVYTNPGADTGGGCRRCITPTRPK